MADQEHHTTRLAEIARSLRAGEVPPPTTVRSFLADLTRNDGGIGSYLISDALSAKPAFKRSLILNRLTSTHRCVLSWLMT